MLTYDHDGNYNITIISNNSDDGDHFQGRHQHHHQHNHFSAFTSSPTTDVSSLPTTVSLSIEPSSIPTAAIPVVTMLLVVVTMQHLGRDGCSALAYLSSEVLCQLCMFITTTFATPTTGHMDAAFIICDIHFDRAVLMVLINNKIMAIGQSLV